MRIRTLLLAAILPLGACSTGYPVYDIPGVSFQPPISAGLEDVAFMEGCWRGGEVNGPTAEEHFSIPGAGTMLGWSRRSRNGRLGSWEFQRVVDEVDALVLEVWPNGEKSPARFVLSLVEPGVYATFEDLAHDYPKRIRYQLVQDDLMQITIDGGPSGQGDVQQLTMARVPCGSR